MQLHWPDAEAKSGEACLESSNLVTPTSAQLTDEAQIQYSERFQSMQLRTRTDESHLAPWDDELH
jgi:hypothetical protein